MLLITDINTKTKSLDVFVIKIYMS